MRLRYRVGYESSPRPQTDIPAAIHFSSANAACTPRRSSASKRLSSKRIRDSDAEAGETPQRCSVSTGQVRRSQVLTMECLGKRAILPSAERLDGRPFAAQMTAEQARITCVSSERPRAEWTISRLLRLLLA